MRFTSRTSVLEAEEVGIMEALPWTDDFPAHAIVVESDPLQGINAINKENVNLLEQGDVIEQCRNILRRKVGISVVYVKKRANKMAHRLARIPCELNSFIISSSTSTILLETILSDILLS